ncbi:hypothetical protein CTRI78_v009028 [Colletotrichum trifolii]|uniref:Uncharacterized protein n=1 Tax=Colletotrichum trifolii TaxID=5466 RepID=A0A4R8QXF6_COLTR|nr:hypothetical protein CTRI78_v009028 [Colletotrichum trifolii]
MIAEKLRLSIRVGGAAFPAAPTELCTTPQSCVTASTTPTLSEAEIVDRVEDPLAWQVKRRFEEPRGRGCPGFLSKAPMCRQK